MNHIYNKKILREFGIIIGVFFPLLIGLIIPYLNGHRFQYWSLFVSLPTILLALIKPYLLITPYKVWMSFGDVLGWFNSKLILGFVFTFVLMPIAFL